MANIKPFRGIRYDQDRIDSINNVISQPYDRVRYGLQEKYYDLSPYNVTRIIKGKESDQDNEANSVYTRAKDFLEKWLEEGILVREDHPAYYVYHQSFPLPSGETITRKAFISAFELAAFNEGIVLPHEKTHAGPKIDRLKLTRATETYLGNIFMLYPDPENRITAIFDRAIQHTPDIEAQELYEKDVLHQVWVVTDPEVLAAVSQEMAPKTNLIIADGHHRYETALNYQAEMQQKHPDAPPEAGFNYRMVAMVSMSDPGLVILPTHRLIFDYQKLTSEKILERAGTYFQVEELTSRSELEQRLDDSGLVSGVLGLVSSQGFYLLTLQDQNVMAELEPDRVPAWRNLDVSILHSLLLTEIMEIDQEAIDKLEKIKYLREPDLGYDEVQESDNSFLFILKPTRIEQVTACADTGEKMPQKSTDFYPKIITGLAMLPVQASERL